MLICGNADLDMHELEIAASYEGGYSSTHPTIRSFWNVVHSLDATQQRQLLAFVTGSDRVPIKGLATLSFCIQRAGPDSDRLPTAHTCFNSLLLPDYATELKLRDRLLIALSCSNQGFGLL